VADNLQRWAEHKLSIIVFINRFVSIHKQYFTSDRSNLKDETFSPVFRQFTNEGHTKTPSR
jgi:hypothetical protein